MARMMPAYCPESAPPGEKLIFAALRDGEGTDDWLVLHSLGIADHVRQVEGEADFVVIVPGAGIVVIEAKSHLSIGRLADGRWKLGSQAPTARSPFQQVSEAMHSLRKFLEKKNVSLYSIPTCDAVWFTGVRARAELPENPEWHDWQVLDSEDLKSAPGSVRRVLFEGTKHLESKLKNFSKGGVGPDSDSALRIANTLRPKFELVSMAGDRRRECNAQLLSFIDEQFTALDAAADNRSVLFTGPAGSGKTLLATEAARREVGVGKKGRLLCFNRLLGRRLASQVGDVGGLSVGTFHQELLRLGGMTQAPANARSHFWEVELPERALDRLIGGETKLVSDFLIVDEVQDLCNELYLDVLDLMVEGGLKDGRVLLFGDFERQAIYGNEGGRELLKDRAPGLSLHRLVYNCRNLPRIAIQVNLLSQLRPGYQQFRRQDDGVNPTFVKYKQPEDQSRLLVKAIRGLREEGFGLNEIVVLSPLRDKALAATTNDPWLKQILKPADGMPAGRGIVHASTIHAFKGLESPAVILTDLDASTCGEGFDSLAYVGMTRATDRIVVLIESDTLRTVTGGNA